MTIGKRLLVLATVVAALAVPAVGLADDGGGSASGTAARQSLGVRIVKRLERQLDRRFQVFSKHCLVQNAPDRCATAADRFATGLGRSQTALQKLEAKIKETCSAASPPPRCANGGQVTQALDSLLAKIASDISAIKAAFPNAGS